MPVDDIKTLVDAADLTVRWVQAKAKGNKVEYLGTEDVDGSDAHKLRVVEANGDKRIIYLDPDYFSRSAFSTSARFMVTKSEQEVDLGDYEKVNRRFTCLSSRVGPKGATEKAQL